MTAKAPRMWRPRPHRHHWQPAGAGPAGQTTLISPGDKVIVEGPTFPATIQCFRLYGAELIQRAHRRQRRETDELEKLIAEHKPKFVYLIPTFGNPSGAMLSLERRKAVLEMAVSTTP